MWQFARPGEIILFLVINKRTEKHILQNFPREQFSQKGTETNKLENKWNNTNSIKEEKQDGMKLNGPSLNGIKSKWSRWPDHRNRLKKADFVPGC